MKNKHMPQKLQIKSTATAPFLSNAELVYLLSEVTESSFYKEADVKAAWPYS